jgi:hypothetical protein
MASKPVRIPDTTFRELSIAHSDKDIEKIIGAAREVGREMANAV